MKSFLLSKETLPQDLKSSITVWLVALPLCLGIAQASDASPLSGLIAGIVGGIMVGAFSGSGTSVSGPAAGLTSIVAVGIKDIGTFEGFLMAVVIAGVLQILAGSLKLGRFGDFIPNAVIKGMLSAIGLTLILKQAQHAVGYDADYEGDEDFMQGKDENTFSALLHGCEQFEVMAVILSVSSLMLLLFASSKQGLKNKLFQYLPAPFLVVILGIGFQVWSRSLEPGLAFSTEHLIQIPPLNFGDASSWQFPNFGAMNQWVIWQTALVLFIVASAESILSIEAVDKLDPYRRITNPNRELFAQGIGNITSGLIGGLPVTSVIVRSSANVVSGARTKMSAIFHGVLLLVSILAFPQLLNLIPKSSLAAILIFTGYNLAKPTFIKAMFKKGWDQFIPFAVTILVILFTNLLLGIVVGLLVGLYFTFKSNFKSAVTVVKDGKTVFVKLNFNVTFLNKSKIKTLFGEMEEGTYVIIDGTQAHFIDKDIIELIHDFEQGAPNRAIEVEVKRSKSSKNKLFRIIE